MHMEDEGRAVFGCVADQTEGFSPADLQALLADAQLSAVHDLVGGGGGDEGGLPVVTEAHVMAALRGSQCSVTPDERLRLDRIYSEFVATRTPGAAHATMKSHGKLRATLA
jgi:peroxin-1